MRSRRIIHDEAGVHVELEEGRLAGLRFRPLPSATPGEQVHALASALTAAWLLHREATIAASSVPPPDPDPDREFVMEFVADELTRASHVTPRTGPQWRLPGRADGRDASGRVHVSLDDSGIVVLEVPPDLLADSRAASAAVVAAFNLARERVQADTLAFMERIQQVPRDPDEVSWVELAHRVGELRRGDR